MTETLPNIMVFWVRTNDNIYAPRALIADPGTSIPNAELVVASHVRFMRCQVLQDFKAVQQMMLWMAFHIGLHLPFQHAD